MHLFASLDVVPTKVECKKKKKISTCVTVAPSVRLGCASALRYYLIDTVLHCGGFGEKIHFHQLGEKRLSSREGFPSLPPSLTGRQGGRASPLHNKATSYLKWKKEGGGRRGERGGRTLPSHGQKRRMSEEKRHGRERRESSNSRKREPCLLCKLKKTTK